MTNHDLEAVATAIFHEAGGVSWEEAKRCVWRETCYRMARAALLADPVRQAVIEFLNNTTELELNDIDEEAAKLLARLKAQVEEG